MTATKLGLLLMVNLVLPMLFDFALQGFDRQAWTVAFLICLIVVFTLNQALGLKRRIIWPIQALNLLTAFTFGKTAFFVGLPDWYELLLYT